MYFFMWKVIISLQVVKFPGKELPRFPTFSSPNESYKGYDRHIVFLKKGIAVDIYLNKLK